MHTLQNLLTDSLGAVYTAASVEIRHRNAVIYRAQFGTTDREGDLLNGAPVKKDTLFDLASLTKLFTTTAFLRLVEAGRVKIDTPLSDILPEFSGARPIRPYDDPLNLGQMVSVVPPTTETVDASAITFRQVLSHSSGLPAWVNLRLAATEAERRQMILESPFAYPSGSRVVYSDVGFMLLGLAIEKITDAPLKSALNRLVIRPLEMDARFGKIAENVPPTEFDQAWRGRRVWGEVHDENAATLNGIAGHAGLFGTASDCATLGQIYLSEGGGFIGKRLAREATTHQIADRGLGWMMRSAEGSSSGQFFSAESYGHTGFVGTSLWVDPGRKIVAALLTNNVFFGRDKTAILAFRPRFHDALIEALG
ncbi:MAG TPA: serine hydrolase domain-containing protein [Aggregatilineales bacterium]|nr:beta-lactamase family protein [Anaerolineales bacterium]HRE49334.1 serine hydrolase domain-containing protein [Aggregatilineales bacterium]